MKESLDQRAAGVDLGPSSAPTAYAMVATGTKVESPGSKPCPFLDKLPREIRDKIWRHILLRPVTILPEIRTTETRWSTGKENAKHKHCRYDRKYTYIWAHNSGEEDNNSEPQPLLQKVSWITYLTREQLKLIDNGVVNFEIGDYPEPGRQVQCAVHHRNGFGPQIINRTEVELYPFGRSVDIMRVCKKFEEECGSVLYGDNAYQFNTQLSHKRSDLKEMPWRIPGFQKEKGKAIGLLKLDKAVDKLFDLHCRHPAFIYKDPFIRFIAYIGRKNASHLRDIKFEGMFKSILLPNADKDSHIGFGTILPIYAVIIGEICPRLRKLTLHQWYPNRTWERFGWSDDLKKSKKMSDEDMVDSIVAKLITGLPFLRELQLGAYSQVPTDPLVSNDRHRDVKDEWGRSLQWMKFVEERNKDQGPETGTSDNTSNSGTSVRHAGARTGDACHDQDPMEHERPGSYGTSSCIWTLTRCPIRESSRYDEPTTGYGVDRRNQYGYLLYWYDFTSTWRCKNAHGGVRDRDGYILNVSDKVDNDNKPLVGKRGKGLGWRHGLIASHGKSQKFVKKLVANVCTDWRLIDHVEAGGALS
ncbi:hypothetical protein SBOR_9199 [Sclerotinia borealis F-4128]|uniref:Uncharacterized protein n=1 Tax=Sclerotinia borealis (strain F-4128) TaxID=1432307 RepID=W9C3G6_SCLBF|nr:hypothetical protein SBOR_9199 [Sclerotinia borealis F-4128]